MEFDFDPTQTLPRARTPPASWYLDDAVWQRERATVFSRNWLVAARLEQLAEPGSFVTGEVAGLPYVITRDVSGQLHALVNVCRHRGATVAAGCGTAERMVCPYHGWAYALNGRLVSAPRLGAVEGFDCQSQGLESLAVATWARWVFIAVSQPAWSCDAALAPLADALATRDTASLTYVATRRYLLDCNWKVFVDNYLDGGYHVPRLHGGLAGQLNLADYRSELFDWFSIQSCGGQSAATPCPAATEGLDFSERIGGGALYGWVYPNLMLNRYGPILDTNWVLPLGPQRCEVVFDYYFAEPRQSDFVQRSLAASDAVQQEDVAICRRVQQGLASGWYRPGPYSVLHEAPQHHFHCRLAADLQAG